MSYEIPIPKLEVLKEKPLDSVKLMEYLNTNGFNPIAVSVDNNLGKVLIYFDKPLTTTKSKKLLELVDDFVKKHLG